MSAPNGINFRSVGKSTGETLSPATAAAMCSGMPELWWSAARLKWAGDRAGTQLLHDKLIQFATRLKSEEKWKLMTGDDHIEKMVMLALLETADPHQWRFDVSKSKYLGIKNASFCATWRSRHEAIRQEIDDWCTLAVGHIYKKISD